MVTIGPFIDTYSQASWGVTRAQTNYFRQTNFALVCKELESLLQNIWEGYIKLSPPPPNHDRKFAEELATNFQPCLHKFDANFQANLLAKFQTFFIQMLLQILKKTCSQHWNSDACLKKASTQRSSLIVVFSNAKSGNISWQEILWHSDMTLLTYIIAKNLQKLQMQTIPHCMRSLPLGVPTVTDIGRFTHYKWKVYPSETRCLPTINGWLAHFKKGGLPTR